MRQSIKISIVSPVYGAEELIDQLVERIKLAVEKITDQYEIILVDDCGPDRSWLKIEKQALIDERVKGIKLSRNFGQHYAISAGLDYSSGEWVVVMDCDLQDQPEEIIKLYEKAISGYDVVVARRHDRKDSFSKILFSRAFYIVMSFMTGTKLDSTIANFGIYHRKVVSAVCSMRENIRVFPIMVKWVGFNTVAIDVEHAQRHSGKSSYNFKRLFNLAIDILLAYSDKPLRLTVKVGVFISLTAVLFTLYNIVTALSGGFAVLGYASIISSIWFLSGLMIFFLGVHGLYLGKIFQGVKDRPIYIVNDKINVPNFVKAEGIQKVAQKSSA